MALPAVETSMTTRLGIFGDGHKNVEISGRALERVLDLVSVLRISLLLTFVDGVSRTWVKGVKTGR